MRTTIDPLLDGSPTKRAGPAEVCVGRLPDGVYEQYEAEWRDARVKWQPAQRDAIMRECLSRIRAGETSRQIGLLPHMPAQSVLWEWLWSEQWRDEAEAAFVAQLERYREQIVEIAEDGSNDWMEIENERGRVQIVLNKEHVARSKLRIDARQWLLTKLSRARYGDRTQVDVTVNAIAPDVAASKAGHLLQRLELLQLGAAAANDSASALPLVERVGP